MICNAKDLSPDQKAAIETLLGRRIQEDEAVSVRTFEPVAVSHQRRLEIANELRKYFAEVDAARKPVSEEEAEDIITEAMRSVRPVELAKVLLCWRSTAFHKNASTITSVSCAKQPRSWSRIPCWSHRFAP